MKFFVSAAAALASLAVVQAQNIVINAPAPQSTFNPGDQVVVDVARGPSRLVSQDVSVAIGILNCEVSRSCGDIDTQPFSFGTLLFSGPYAPQQHADGFSQNYTVTIPTDFPSGNTELSVVHFYLLPSTDTIALTEIQHEPILIN
ncbi:hypothetical protein C8Q79DRAFT_1008296 [Trametes meyenii]|nr:hypothetical protein C8Q79DRAFT_1008296 [Trametes meyenii]